MDIDELMNKKRPLALKSAPTTDTVLLIPDDRVLQRLRVRYSLLFSVYSAFGTGKQTRAFVRHEIILRKLLTFLPDCFRRGWPPRTEATNVLPDLDPLHFELFSSFAYTGKIDRRYYVEGDAQSLDDQWHLLARCRVLGEKLGSPTFQDYITD